MKISKSFIFSFMILYSVLILFNTQLFAAKNKNLAPSSKENMKNIKKTGELLINRKNLKKEIKTSENLKNKINDIVNSGPENILQFLQSVVDSGIFNSNVVWKWKTEKHFFSDPKIQKKTQKTFTARNRRLFFN